MKNFKRSLALVLALIMIVGTFASVSAFSVGAQAWYADAIYDLQAWGVITEDDVDSAMNNKIIDRKTFTLWVAKILSQDCDGKIWEEQVETRYDDVEYAAGSDDNSSAIAYATANGIVRGYNEGPDYQFGPDDSLKLGQGAVIVIRLLSRFGDQGSDLYSTTYLQAVQNIKDAFDMTEYAAYMYWAQQIDVIDEVYKDNCTSYADGASLTYGEAAYLIWNAAKNCFTAVEKDKYTKNGAYDADTNPNGGKEGTIAELFENKDFDIDRTYYGIVTNVATNNTDEVAGLTISLQVSSDEFVTLTLTQAQVKALVVDANKKKTDNVGNVNSDALYVSVRDFTVGTLVKVSYNGNAANDSSNGTLSYNKDKFVSVTKTNSVIVDSFLVYKYGWCGKNGGYKYNHLYNELVANPSASAQKLNQTPVLPGYYSDDLSITKSSATRTVNKVNYTVYSINFKGVDYVLAYVGGDGKVYVANGLKAESTDNVIIVNDATGANVDAAALATVYAGILNTAEGQMKFTFTDTDGNGDYDIMTQNKASVAFNHSTTTDLNRAADAVNGTYVLFNKSVLRPGEKVADEKVVTTGTGTAYVDKGVASTGLTALLMNNAGSTVLPFYKQVALLDSTGASYKLLTGMVTDVQTIGEIKDYYKVVITDAEGNDTSVIIPAYSKLFDAKGVATKYNRTFTYYVGEDSSKITVDTHSWYEFLIDTYNDMYANNAGEANNFPATEANKPTALLQKTVTVALDASNNVIVITGRDLTTSDDAKAGFVTKVEKASNDNEFNVTLSTTTGTATTTVIASLSAAYDWETREMLNRLFANGLLSDTDAEKHSATGVGYEATENNVLYLNVKNDGGNNYVVKGADSEWKPAVISGDITNRIFDAKTTYGPDYKNQTAIKVPTTTKPEVVNYYNAYTAEKYKWTVVAKSTNDKGDVTSVAYEKAPAAIYQVQYSQVSKLAIDFTKSYTLQPVYDGGVVATGATKVLAPFTVYTTTVDATTGDYKTIANPTYAEIYAYQTHKYYKADGTLDTTKGYGFFYDDDANDDGLVDYVGNLSNVTMTRYYVDANNVVYTILDYKGLVYQTNADGSLVVVTEDVEVVGTAVNVTTDALAGNLADLTLAYIKSSLPSNTEFSAHAKNEGYKYVPGWYRLEIKGAETLNVKDDTKIVIVTPSEDTEVSKTYLDYNYTETTFGALRASKKELAVLAYQYYVDPNKGYVTYLTVFGGTNTVGSNSTAGSQTPSTETEIDTTKAIVYLPASSLTNAFVQTGDDIYYVRSTMQAINITTGEKVGQLNYYYSTWNYGADYVHSATKHNVEIPAGHFYLIDTTKNNAILEDLGPVWTSTGAIERGNVQKDFKYLWNGSWKNSSSWSNWSRNTIHTFDNNKVYTVSDMNNQDYSYDTSLLATGTVLGKFGTMTITDVTPSSIIATVDSNANQDITNLKFKFVYFDYAGDNLYEVTGSQNVAKDMPTSGLDIIFKAEGYTVAEFYKYFTEEWVQSYYGKTADVQAEARKTLDQKTPAVYYANAVTAYNNAVIANKPIADIEAAAAKVEEAKALLAEFEADYAEVQNDIFWSSDVVNSKLYQYKVAQTTSGATVEYPTFTYYYDYATSTYTVFVTSFDC